MSSIEVMNTIERTIFRFTMRLCSTRVASNAEAAYGAARPLGLV